LGHLPGWDEDPDGARGVAGAEGQDDYELR